MHVVRAPDPALPGRRPFGLGYGVIWWVLGALILMPLRLGMGVFGINATSMSSLMGHLLFGAIMGAVVVLLARRSASA